MDVVQKVRDLARLALDERAADNERLQAAVAALRLINQYKLLETKKKVDVAADIVEKITSPDFVEGIADRAEKFASSFERVVGSVKKVAGAQAPRRGRRYRGR